jgi:hypothetical protein
MFHICSARDWDRIGLLEDRVSFETSFDSKQPKLEPKLVSALSETKCLFRFFRFYAETESFDVSIEPKQTEDQPKQFKREYVLCKRYVQLSHLIPVTTHILREHILISFTKKFGFFRFISFFFFVFSVFSLLYRNREFRCFD